VRGSESRVARRWLETRRLYEAPSISATINWLEVEIASATGKVADRTACVTDLPVNANTIAELIAAGRARWKTENEIFNVLNTKGHNLKRNFGDGQKDLSAVLATLNSLAFAFHTVAGSTEDLCQKAATIAHARAGLFAKMARNRGPCSLFCPGEIS
jgi:hypothetical protein